MGEFELIDAIVAELGAASGGPAVVVGPGDDAAVVTVPTGHQLVTSVDTLVADIHFPIRAPARLIAERALRVSVSDLAAMGATPLAAVVALVLPTTTQARWVRDLSAGFASAAKILGCPVTGGNLTAGELSLSVTVQGIVPAGDALLRSGAQVGDDVWVSGALGGAAVALQDNSLTQIDAAGADMSAAQERYYLPPPRLALGVALRKFATSAIDISDGLAADLGHIAKASGLGIDLTAQQIPRFAGATLAQALHGGDDYELCFTAPASNAQKIRRLAPDAVAIGSCVGLDGRGEPTESLRENALRLDGEVLEARGYDHFRASEKSKASDIAETSNDG